MKEDSPHVTWVFDTYAVNYIMSEIVGDVLPHLWETAGVSWKSIFLNLNSG
jgi:hypothetical protein